MKNLSKTLGIDNIVSFRGVTNDVEKYYEASNIFILPSIFEGFGLVIIEAFRASLPVVTTNIEGPKELIINGENGFLFEPSDHKQLSAHIQQLYLSPELRNKIGKNGYLSYKGKYNMDDYAKKIETLYLE